MRDGRPALGSATRGPHIFDCRAPWGGPRFYPRGEHPATYQLRTLRQRLTELNDRAPSPGGYELLDYLDGQLEMFEAGEDWAKRYEWERLRCACGIPPR